jgi:hypothetical protein
MLMLSGVFVVSSNPAWASCLPEGCQQISLEVQSCAFTTISNKEDIEEYLQNSQLEADVADQWRSKIVEYRGLTLEGRVQTAARISCVDGQKPQEGFPLRLHKGYTGRFFYLDSKASCQDLDDVLVARFYSDCCDTLPATGTCTIGDILLQSPKRRRKDGGAPARSGKADAGTTREPVLPKKSDLFGQRRF